MGCECRGSKECLLCFRFRPFSSTTTDVGRVVLYFFWFWSYGVSNWKKGTKKKALRTSVWLFWYFRSFEIRRCVDENESIRRAAVEGWMGIMVRSKSVDIFCVKNDGIFLRLWQHTWCEKIEVEYNYGVDWTPSSCSMGRKRNSFGGGGTTRRRTIYAVRSTWLVLEIINNPRCVSIGGCLTTTVWYSFRVGVGIPFYNKPGQV